MNLEDEQRPWNAPEVDLLERRRRGRRPRKALSLLPALVPFTTDKAVYAIARGISGFSGTLNGDPHPHLALGDVTGGKTKRYGDLYITMHPNYIASPGAGEDALDRIISDRDEFKGKVFVGTLGLAKWVLHQNGDPGKFLMSLRDLMKLFFGYELKTKTDSKRYWKGAAQLTKYLFVDLPDLEISLHLTSSHGPHKGEPRHYREVLMRQPGVYAVPGHQINAGFRERVRSLATANNIEELAVYLQRSNIEGYTLGYEHNALEVLGGAALNVATELMAHEVLALTGPAWWLAYRVIAHLRRWQSGKDVYPEKGKLLIEALREPGYLEEQHRPRFSFKEAIRAWLNDVARLVELQVLEAPGVRIYQLKGKRWTECSDEFDQIVSSGKELRIREGRLEGYRVLYALPAARRAEMQGVQKRSDSLKRSAQNRQASNNAVSDSEKPPKRSPTKRALT